jgi:hypothetical protein
MENFDVDWGKNNNNSSDTLNMQVSLACKKDGRKVVYVTFSEAIRSDKPLDKKLFTVLNELSI